jgi:hypothetical protein
VLYIKVAQFHSLDSSSTRKEKRKMSSYCKSLNVISFQPLLYSLSSFLSPAFVDIDNCSAHRSDSFNYQHSGAMGSVQRLAGHSGKLYHMIRETTLYVAIYTTQWHLLVLISPLCSVSLKLN